MNNSENMNSDNMKPNDMDSNMKSGSKSILLFFIALSYLINIYLLVFVKGIPFILRILMWGYAIFLPFLLFLIIQERFRKHTGSSKEPMKKVALLSDDQISEKDSVEPIKKEPAPALEQLESVRECPEKRIIDRAQAIKMSGDIVIPDTMNEIHHRLFDKNEKITSVVIPGTVKRIAFRAFAECTNLEKVILNEGIEEIEPNVFINSRKLRKVIYPDSVRKYNGRTFYLTNLKEPVMNTSGTLLVFCPASVSGREWTVPDTVKTIACQAFFDSEELEILHFPEGLQKIENMAFPQCSFQELIIPYSVQEIGEEAFLNCRKLEKVTILNPDTKVCFGAFSRCVNLREINYANLTESDRLFQLKGEPFLIHHLEDSANLNHQSDPQFEQLTTQCAIGDTCAMNALAEWFEVWSHKPDASLFYIRAANYWRYIAYRRGDQHAAEWFRRFFAEHPGEHLESVLDENYNHIKGFFTHSISGKILNDLGYSFFKPEDDYEIERYEDEDLIIASCFYNAESPDEDGYGAEVNYLWYFLDENMQPCPGVEDMIATIRERDFRFFSEKIDKAIEILKQRKKECR